MMATVRPLVDSRRNFCVMRSAPKRLVEKIFSTSFRSWNSTGTVWNKQRHTGERRCRRMVAAVTMVVALAMMIMMTQRSGAATMATSAPHPVRDHYKSYRTGYGMALPGIWPGQLSGGELTVEMPALLTSATKGICFLSRSASILRSASSTCF
jgi:hypothetical protein